MQTFVIAQCDFFSFYHIVVKEIFEQALLAHNLPLTIVVGLFMLYWILSMVGVFAVDSIDFDMDIDAGDPSNPTPTEEQMASGVASPYGAWGGLGTIDGGEIVNEF